MNQAIQQYDKLNDNQIKDHVRKTLTSIMNCQRTGAPLDLNTFKQIHREEQFAIHNIIHNKSKSEDVTHFEEYIRLPHLATKSLKHARSRPKPSQNT